MEFSGWFLRRDISCVSSIIGFYCDRFFKLLSADIEISDLEICRRFQPDSLLLGFEKL